MPRRSMNAGNAASCDQPPPPAASSLAPGFRFHPTDEELVSYYLKRKVCGRPLRIDAVAEVDLYKCEPWDLPGRSRIRSRDLEWYFFSPLDRKYSNRSRTNRATPQGYWKTTGKDRPVCRGPRVVGMKKTLVYHAGRAPGGTRTNWVMHEYRLKDEELTQAGISQNAFVVCRIFQKSGAGPQNGAQYGAPFLEEEWEVEADDAVVLMPDGGEDEFNEAAEQEYLHFGDFVKNVDLGNQHANASNFVADLDEDYGGLTEDATILLDMTLDGTSFTDMVECIDEPGQQISQSPTDDMEKETLMEEHTHNHSPPNEKDEYVELNDLTDSANAAYPLSEESSYPIRTFHAQNMDGIDGNSNLQKMLDIEDFFDTMSQNSDPLESYQMTSAQDNFYVQPNDLSPVPHGCPSSQQLQENMVFCDAPRDNLAFEHEKDQFTHSPVDDTSGFEMINDLLAYFDATNDKLYYDTIGFPGCSECTSSSDKSNFTGEVCDGNCSRSKAPAQVPDTHIVGGASSSASSVACSKTEGNHEDVTVKPDAHMKDGNAKTISKCLVNMLGSIPAPPAFAAEYPAGAAKSMAQTSAVHPTSSTHVTAGFVHICDPTVSGSVGHWSLQKNGHAGFILSYRMADNVSRKTSDFVPSSKNQYQWCFEVAYMFSSFYHCFLQSAIKWGSLYVAGAGSTTTLGITCSWFKSLEPHDHPSLIPNQW
ncbi:hypothetical protein C4D60_Mb09t20400 [Musa balbisiana]|uniref:NAC domain-containing protein n=1 Tax=Musa balbisiana TaxID=52838 RepID=A0A4S8IHS1_MUSBA|nr:hypothetical protein C4D60_Mb09t20400 [Musa balbisiana]